MDSKIKLRLNWIKLYKQIGNAGQTCQHYGISRFTLRKWYKRYEELGEQGLSDFSSKPINSPLQKRDETNERLVLDLRKSRSLGARRLQNELKRLHDISFSTATIHKVLKKHNIGYLKLKRHYRKQIKHYSRKILGERVQMDVCKIKHKLYQYTAIDDCTRYKVVALYTRRTAENTLNFLDQVIERMPFYCQTIQTDRGQEFFAYAVQERLRELKINFRPIKPFSPHLNGKVERAQRTDLDEFYSSIDLDDPELVIKLQSWEEYYNKQRSHSSLGGKTPSEKYEELQDKIPTVDEIQKLYKDNQPFAVQNYKYDQQIKLLHELQKKQKVET
jgi:transposase InsO family protein